MTDRDGPNADDRMAIVKAPDEGFRQAVARLKKIAGSEQTVVPSMSAAKTASLMNEAAEEVAASRREQFERQEEQLERDKLHAKLAIANTAGEFHRRLVESIVEFDNALDETEEVGVRLVSFGQTMQFHARDISFLNPSLIVFSGITEDNKSIELIQHVSQISFLLMALPRLDPDQPKHEMGYHTLHRQNSQDAEMEEYAERDESVE